MRSRLQRRAEAVLTVLLALGVLAAVPLPSLAATHTVEHDGSGDYTIIQDAIDAAAPGDTIRIGPGEYPEVQQRLVRRWASQFNAYVSVHIDKPDLTLIGSGKELSIVGQDSLQSLKDGLSVITFWVDFETPGTVVEDLGLRHGAKTVNLEEGASFRRCSFSVAKDLLVILPMRSSTGASFVDCKLDGGGVPTTGITSAVGSEIPSFYMSNCTVEQTGTCVQLEDCADATIEGNEFMDSATGVALLTGTKGVIRNCKFVRLSHTAIHSTSLPPPNTLVEDCIIEPYAGLQGSLNVSGRFRANRVVFGGGSYTTVYISGRSNIVIRDSHIFNTNPSSGHTVYSYAAEEDTVLLDFRQNWWGTTDSTQVAEWILDGVDPECTPAPCDTVQFIPMLQAPVSTQRQSFGGLKGAPRPR